MEQEYQAQITRTAEQADVAASDGVEAADQSSHTTPAQAQQADAQDPAMVGTTGTAALSCSYSPEKPLITNKSNKLEWQDGEDAKLKQMLWVVENLQEELFRSQEHRLQAEKQQHNDRTAIESLQAELQTVSRQLAALDDDLDMIQQQLEHQMVAQDQNKDDARQLDKELMSLQALIHVRERSAAEKDRRIADIEKQIWNDIEDAKAQKRREQAENASPRSDASSPWGSPSEGSDDEARFKVSPVRLPLSAYGRERLTPAATSTTGAPASAERGKGAAPAPSGWFRPFSMLGAGRKVESDGQAGQKATSEVLRSAGSSPQPIESPLNLSRAASFGSAHKVQRTSSGL